MMIGQTISHYKILEKLGEGGMGVVYKAQDLKLDRLVALKFLPPHLAADEQDKKRFIHEAKAASVLDHPNICNVHEIDETPDGQLFIVMALYEGTALNKKIEQAPLTIEETLNIAIQTAEGLQAAHEKGIAHRDIKSSNVMITEKGRAVVMDFGLARTTGATKLTKKGATLGTVPYMSPEQARGEKVDHRTDIWSLGVVLYEMMIGRMPFRGDYSEAIVYQILNEEPEAITSMRSNVPMEFERIVKKAMQKDCNLRYQRVEEMLVDLRAVKKETESGVSKTKPIPARSRKRNRLVVTAGLAAGLLVIVIAGYILLSREPTEKNSIAVLPFQNLGGGQKMDFLRLALADEITTTLSYTHNLAVRPSASTRKYAGPDVDPQFAGRELGVVTIITGQFLRGSDGFRVSLEAIDVKNNQLLWRETVRAQEQDWIGMEEQIRNRVRQRLIPALGLAASPDEEGARPTNAEAYELHMRSVAYPNSENKQAIAMLQRAVLLDPGYASAWAALGQRYNWSAAYEDGSDKAYEQAKQAYRHALELDPNMVLAARGLIALTVESGQLAEAYDMAQDLLRRRPENALAHYSLSYVFRFAGLLAEAAQECETARALDPQEGGLRACGFAFMMAGDYERSLSFWAIGPETEWSNNAISLVLLRQGKYDEVLRITSKLAQNPTWPARFVDAYLQKKSASEVKKHADEYIRNTLRLRRDPESAYLDGALLAFCDQRVAALQLLRLAVNGNFCMADALDTDPLLENVRSTPEFAEIRAAANECQKKLLTHRITNK
ncbi:MAG: protein kinase [Bacteroidota bacterium]